VRWSLDGSCIAYRATAPDHHSKALVVHRLRDGVERDLGHGDLGHQVWSADGRVHVLTSGGDIRSFGAPDIWDPPPDYVRPRHETIVPFPNLATRQIALRKFSVETARDRAFIARDLPAGLELLFLECRAHPPVLLSYVMGNSSYPPRTVLLSVRTGETLLEFSPQPAGVPGFYGTTLGLDGNWIIGEVVQTDGHAPISGEIWIASRTGRWIQKLPSVNGTSAKCPERGRGLAYRDLARGVVAIGQLVVTP
jgi:hypothetical protein